MLWIGAPVWQCKAWLGTWLPNQIHSREFLRHYATVFNAVEGNSTFYALPSSAQVSRWKDHTPAHFRFCFKLPKAITHESQLRNCEAALTEFLDRLAPLEERLGPMIVQLPPSFGPRNIDLLDRFLGFASKQFRYAVEVRHPKWFERDRQALLELLGLHGAEFCVFDTASVHASELSDHSTLEAQARKPKAPLRRHALSPFPTVRFAGSNHLAECVQQLDAWLPSVRTWLEERRAVHFFCHAPDDAYAPELVAYFLRALGDRSDVPKLREPDRSVTQLSLF
jgi:uncharacterized protein YecE (DUF72 family)